VVPQLRAVHTLPVPRTGLTREEKKAETRRQLLDAAATVFARRGFAAASLDEVAEEAGLTKGAVYSNFESKQDLFDAVQQERLEAQMMAIADLVPQGPLADEISQTARLLNGIMREQRDWFLLAIEFAIYTARHPEYATEYATGLRADNLRRRAEVARLIEERSHVGGALPVSADRLSMIMNAMIMGVALMRLTEPDLPDDVLELTLELVFKGLEARAEGQA